MKHFFTPDDLVRFIYHEVSADEEARIKLFITENPEAAEELQLLMQSVMELESVSLEPSESSVNIILDYSREHAPEESHC
jgi:hypothetical protein